MRFFLIALFLASCSHYSLGQCYQSGQNLPNNGYLLVSSGYSGLDAVVYNEIPKLEAFFGVKVDFFFLLESYSENAMYIHSCNYNCDGTIALGIKLLYSEFLNDPTLTTVKAALAHEFAHCIQKLQGWDEKGKRRELHSDFLAGYYLRKTHSYANYDAFDKAIYSFYNKGDFDFWNPGHHGTPEERSCALMCGWNLGGEPYNFSILQASNKALEYVFADNPCGTLPTLSQNAERRLISQTQSNNNFNNRPWKYDVRHVNDSFSKMISIGFSPSKISGVPWSIFYEPTSLYSKKKYRYNLQFRNKDVDSFNQIGFKTKYLSIGADSKHYFSRNTMNSNLYYSYSLQARYLSKIHTLENMGPERMFYMVPALRIGLEGASEWISGATFDMPTNGNYNYCHNLVKYNRIVFSSDLGIAFYSPIGKFGLEFNLMAGFRFN